MDAEPLVVAAGVRVDIAIESAGLAMAGSLTGRRRQPTITIG